MKLANLEHKRILIAGFGIEGMATKTFLETQVPTARISTTDVSNGAEYLSQQAEYDVVIKTPGIPARDLTVSYTTATNIFFANLPTTIQTIGVTGSKGKSTTASLIHHILEDSGKPVKLVGNIGTPLLSAFDPLDSKTLYVIELSSYQLADIEYSPHISVIVSLFPEHIPYHGSVKKYYQAKKNILMNTSPKDYYVYNPLYPRLFHWAKECKAQAIPYQATIPQTSSRLIGLHNADNIRAAYTVSQLFHIVDTVFTSSVATFQPLPHRLETIGTYQGITFIDDAISTTPESTIAALNAISDVATIFLGGEDRGYNFSKLIELLYEKQVENIVVFPDSGNRIAEELHIKYPNIFNIYHTQDMQSAVAYAFEHTPTGSVCLLSSASPSYSLWKNFQEKGNQFQACIHTHETQEKTH